SHLIQGWRDLRSLTPGYYLQPLRGWVVSKNLERALTCREFLALNLVFHDIKIVVTRVLHEAQSQFVHYVNRCRVLRFGNRHNSIKATLLKAEPQRRAGQLTGVAFAPMTLGEVINNFRRAEKRTQSTEADELTRASINHGPTSESVCLPMLDDAFESARGLFSTGGFAV